VLDHAVDEDLATVDLFDPSWHENGPPHALLARLRAEAPVRWNPLPDGSGCWTVLGHAEVAQASRDFATFSSHEGGVFLHPDQVAPLEFARNLLLYMDPPQHTKYRLILQRAFTPHAVRQLEGAVRARVTSTIDAFIERGTADLVPELAQPIPLGVVMDLLGVPDEDYEVFLGFTTELEEATRSPEPAAGLDAITRLGGYLDEQLKRQTTEGRDDTIVAKLRDATVDDRPLTDAEVLVFFALLAFAGHDTTRNTTSSGVLALLQHPDALSEISADPSLVPVAVEEILRYTSVVQWFNRTALGDVELGGQQITKGDRVVLWYTSASRDAALFNRPDDFDIHRETPDHAAFGGGGRHFCLGSGLARLELTTIFAEVTRRLQNLQLAGEPQRITSSWSNALTRLPVTFDPAMKERA
jgi:cholest-4-en-3-one 26-monooxygenase